MIKNLFYQNTLPLIDKGGSHPSLSAVIRGGPGTGKTTAAMSLAWDIAQAGKGSVLYFCMEATPVELLYKAAQLGISRDTLIPLDQVTAKRDDPSIVVSHAVLNHHAPICTWTEMFDVIHSDVQLIENFVALRAIVIDAITFEGYRNYLVEFIHAMELHGISVVLVEEVLTTPSSIAFAVDVVIDAEGMADGITYRICKSRYSKICSGNRLQSSLTEIP